LLTVPFFFLYNRSMKVAAILLCVLFTAASASAHHSWAAEYDIQRAITLTGKVTKVAWMNPHIYVYFDVKDEAGKSINYAAQGSAPNVLYRMGWRTDTLKPGDIITVVGYKARDGWNRLNARDVTLSDGRRIFAGPAEPTQHN
jgi:hypothetical protein